MTDAPAQDWDGPLYEASKKAYPQKVTPVPPRQMGDPHPLLGVYYFLPFLRWNRARTCRTSGADRSGEPALLLLLHRALAAGGLLLHGPPRDRRDHAVS